MLPHSDLFSKKNIKHCPYRNRHVTIQYMQIDTKKIVNDVEYLLKNYSQIKRKALQPFHYNTYIKLHPESSIGRKNPVFHESLLEHVGMLPILAVYFHQYVNTEIDLGKVLSILAVHDIGELIVGDESTMTKNHKNNTAEIRAAKQILHPNLHTVYMEYEELSTNEALYAKSIDKIAPDFYHLFTDIDLLKTREEDPERITLAKHAKMKMEKKNPFMQWSSFFKAFYPLLIEEYSRRLDDKQKH